MNKYVKIANGDPDNHDGMLQPVQGYSYEKGCEAGVIPSVIVYVWLADKISNYLEIKFDVKMSPEEYC